MRRTVNGNVYDTDSDTIIGDYFPEVLYKNDNTGEYYSVSHGETDEITHMTVHTDAQALAFLLVFSEEIEPSDEMFDFMHS